MRQWVVRQKVSQNFRACFTGVPMDSEQHEVHIRSEPAARERALIDLLTRAESAILSSVALILIALAVIAFLATVAQVAQPLLSPARDYETGVTNGISAAFLVLILAELLHTTLSRGPVSRQLQEFLVIGVTVGVRHSLEVAAAKGDATRLALDLAVNAAAVLILVAALWLVRQQLRADRREARRDEAFESGKQRDTACDTAS